MIPRRLILTHRCERALDPKLRHCMERIREFHPGWEILFFSDADCRSFIRETCPEYLEMYQWYPRAVMRADFFRLLAVHQLGGFYLDTDVWMEEPLDPLVPHEAVFAFEEEMDLNYQRLRFPHLKRNLHRCWNIANYAFAARAGHPFLQAAIDEVIARTADFEVDQCSSLDVLHSTGPDVLTAIYYEEADGAWEDLTVLGGAGCRFGRYGKHLVHSIWWEGF